MFVAKQRYIKPKYHKVPKKFRSCVLCKSHFPYKTDSNIISDRQANNASIESSPKISDLYLK